jgi:tryptophanyl-tRNA synthetase
LNIFAILELFLTPEERQDWRGRIQAGGVGYGHLKATIMEKMDALFGPARARYHALMTTDAGRAELDAVLRAGAALARPLAQATLKRCVDAVGMPNRLASA